MDRLFVYAYERSACAPVAARVFLLNGDFVIPLRIGIQLASLKQPFKQALMTASRLGAQAVEVDAREEIRPKELTQTALRQLRKLLEDLNLRICAVTFRTRRGYGDEEELERRIDATKAAMQMAYSLGASVVINQIGAIPTESEGPTWDRLKMSLDDLGRYGQRVGAMLAAETGAESGPDLARLIAALPEGALGIDFNPGNLIMNSHSVEEAAEALGRNVLHVHATDAVRDLARRRGIEVEMGRGSVDFASLLAQLEEHGYQGYITVKRERSSNAIAEISQAVEYLKEVFRS
jgi:sugar phosphate isomerase/epimerase